MGPKPNFQQDIYAMLVRYRGILFNLCFAAYLLLLEPLFFERLKRVFDRGYTDYFLGVILIATPILELLALRWKAPTIRERLRYYAPDEDQPGLILFLTWMCHTVVSVFTVMTGLKAVGMGWTDGDDVHPFAALLVFAVVIKELVLVMIWMDIFSSSPDNRKEREVGIETMERIRQEWIGDILMLIFSAITMSLMWTFLALRTPIDISNIALMLLNYALATLFFLIVFLPVRGVYLFEELQTPKTRREKIWLNGSIILNVVLALSIIPRV